MRLVGERNLDAFDEVYRRHAWAVAAVASRFVTDRADADEATQSAFMKLWHHANSIVLSGRSLRPWLVTVGRNAAVDSRRSVRTTVRTDADHERIPAPEIGPEDSFIQSDLRRDMQNALAALDPHQKTVVELAYFGGLTQTQISTETGVPLGTVKSRIRLAMRNLRRALGPAEAGLR